MYYRATNSKNSDLDFSTMTVEGYFNNKDLIKSRTISRSTIENGLFSEMIDNTSIQKLIDKTYTRITLRYVFTEKNLGTIKYQASSIVIN